MGRVLAIDPGERRLGLAVSDPGRTIALPLEVRTRKGWRADLEYLRGIVAGHDVDTIVVGRPLTGRGTEGPQAREAARFAARLRDAVSVPVHEVDERFSTAAAERALRATGRSPRERQERRDAVAAALILQPFLDRRSDAGPLRGPNGDVMLAP